MFISEVIGNLGADAEVKDANGSKFVAFRVADTEKWTGQDGKEVTRTTWVDCTLNDPNSKILPYLKQGVKVFVRGRSSLRIYSSPKDRCMKPGISISVREIELVGGQSDEVPRELVVPESGALVKVAKYYQCDYDTSKFKKEEQHTLYDAKGRNYIVVKGGWVCPAVEEQQEGEQ